MTVLLLLDFIPKKRGSMEAFLIRLADAGRKDGMIFHYCLAGEPQQWFLDELPDNAVAHAFPSNPVRDCFLQAARLTRTLHADVTAFFFISIFSLKTLAFTRLPWINRPIFIDQNSMDVPVRSGFLRWLAFSRGRLGGRCYKRIVSVSEFNRRRNVDRSFVPEARTQVIYNATVCVEDGGQRTEVRGAGVRRVQKTGHLGPTDPGLKKEMPESGGSRREGGDRRAAGVGGEAWDVESRESEITNHESRSNYFFYAGQMHRNKGVHTLIKAFTKACEENACSNVQLWLAGEGPHLEDFRKQARASRVADRILFLGLRDDVQSLMGGSIAVMIPSEWPEACAFVTFEAMDSGRPTVVSDAGGLPELVSDCGEIFPRGNADALASVMTDILTRPEVFDKQASRAQKRVSEKFTMNRMVAEYITLLQDVGRDT